MELKKVLTDPIEVVEENNDPPMIEDDEEAPTQEPTQ